MNGEFSLLCWYFDGKSVKKTKVYRCLNSRRKLTGNTRISVSLAWNIEQREKNQMFKMIFDRIFFVCVKNWTGCRILNIKFSVSKTAQRTLNAGFGSDDEHLNIIEHETFTKWMQQNMFRNFFHRFQVVSKFWYIFGKTPHSGYDGNGTKSTWSIFVYSK